jgi:hypothetical protein
VVACRSTQRVKGELCLHWKVRVRTLGQMVPKVIVGLELAGFSDLAMLIFQIDGVPTVYWRHPEARLNSGRRPARRSPGNGTLLVPLRPLVIDDQKI